MCIAERREKFIRELEEVGADIDALRGKLVNKINEAFTKLWHDTAIIGARSSLSAAGLDNAPVIEQIGYLFDECPDENKFEHMPIVPLVYLEHCLVNGKLPPEEEWLRDMIKRVRKKHGNGLVLKMFNVLLNAGVDRKLFIN